MGSGKTTHIMRGFFATGKGSKAWERLLQWRERHVPEKNFVMILALFVGIVAGFAALLLKWLIHTISHFVTDHISLSGSNWLFLVCPLVGILITVFYVKYFVRDNISHGVTRVLRAISLNKSRLKPHNMYSSLISSSITIGFGGSVGAEGPIVATGSAIGSNIGQIFRLSPRILMILVGCGAAAGIAGIFKAPIAGMLFTLEVLMLDLTTVSVMPLLIASVTAATVAYISSGYDVTEFIFEQNEAFVMARVPYVIVLGLFCGLVSVYFTKVTFLMEKFFSQKLKIQWRKTLVGGILLAAMIFIFPPLYGEGYAAINSLLGGAPSTIVEGSPFVSDASSPLFILLFIGLIILLKAFATTATTGAGGIGGTFAPSLFVGCLSGFFFAYAVNMFLPGADLSTKNFALMGMAAVMSGVMHAPLMGIFLTAEMTGGYELFLPLLIVSTVSYGTIKVFLPYSIYTMRLAQKGELLTHHKDKAVLTLLKMDSVVETDFVPVKPDMSLKEMVEVIAHSTRNLFPVVGEQGQLLGVVYLDEIRNIMFRPDLYRRMYVSKFMSAPGARIEIGTPMEKVMRTFDSTGAWNLPVVEKGKYVGFVSKSKIFNSYRRVLKHYSED